MNKKINLIVVLLVIVSFSVSPAFAFSRIGKKVLSLDGDKALLEYTPTNFTALHLTTNPDQTHELGVIIGISDLSEPLTPGSIFPLELASADPDVAIFGCEYTVYNAMDNTFTVYSIDEGTTSSNGELTFGEIGPIGEYLVINYKITLNNVPYTIYDSESEPLSSGIKLKLPISGTVAYVEDDIVSGP